jgi:hypothetical protein
MTSQRPPEVVDRTKRKRNKPVPRSNFDNSIPKKYIHVEDLADTDDDPTSKLSSSPAAPKRCHRIQIITGIP